MPNSAERFGGFEPPTALPAARGPRIGIAWSGNPAHPNDRNRSMPLRAVSPLPDRAGPVCSLRTFVRPADRETPTGTPEINDLGFGFQDFADTAATIAALDPVITVDTSIAHLAATLGKPR